MIVDAISFGSIPKRAVSHEKMQNKAFAEIMKHYQETGKYEPAIIDYFENGETRITYLSDKKSKTQGIFSGIKKFLKKIIKK
ncbi:hypothetical protein HDR58_05555 [bacterium]|nr:hypothetical protein [bacterium]